MISLGRNNIWQFYNLTAIVIGSVFNGPPRVCSSDVNFAALSLQLIWWRKKKKLIAMKFKLKKLIIGGMAVTRHAE